MRFIRSHVATEVLIRNGGARFARLHSESAELLADIAEIDRREAYGPRGHSSMHAFCMAEWDMTRDVAKKHIRAARAARRFPQIFDAVDDGRLHVSGVCMLARQLTSTNVDEMLAGAAHKTKFEIKQLLANHFPRLDVPTQVVPLAPASPIELGAPGPLELPAPQMAARPLDPPVVEPLSPQRYALQVTIDQETHDQIQYAQELLGHSVPSGDVGAVLGRALKALIRELEKQKFAATDRPRAAKCSKPGGRRIPAAVKRAVRERDRGQCTYVSDDGRRCGSRTRVEFDHIEPVARGGVAAVDGVRLLCRTHNQLAAEGAFGREFMRHRREEARRAAAGKRAAAEQRAAEEIEQAMEQDVIKGLRVLGFRIDDARRAATLSRTMPGASLEERFRAAVRSLGKKPTAVNGAGSTV